MTDSFSYKQRRSDSTSSTAGGQVPFQAVIYGFVDVPADIPEEDIQDYVRDHALSDGFWNKHCTLVGTEPDELVDELTNEIMDSIRDTEGLDPDSDADDERYGEWHDLVRSYIQPRD